MTDHIQINDVAPRVQYLADGIQSAFTFPFAIFKLADLEVWLDDSLQASGYTVSGVGVSTGGVALFAVPPPADTRVTLRRRLTIARTTDYQSDGLIRAKTLNDELDYQVAALQQVAEDVDRAVRRAPTALAAIDLTLPEPAAGRGLKWNAGGTALVNSTHDPDAVGDATQAASQAMAAAATASLARDQAVAAVSAVSNPLSATANLSDLDDAHLARANLGVPTAADIAVIARDEEIVVALDDQLLLHDQSAGADRRMQVANLLKAVNLLTADASPDKATDYVMTWDASAGDVKKVQLSAVGGGEWEYVGKATCPEQSSGQSVSTIDFTGLDGGAYDYRLVIRRLRANGNNNRTMLFRPRVAGAPYIDNNYAMHGTIATNFGGTSGPHLYGPSTMNAWVFPGYMNVSAGHVYGMIEIMTTADFCVIANFSLGFGANNHWHHAGQGYVATSAAIDGFTLSLSGSDAFVDGVVELWRRAKH